MNTKNLLFTPLLAFMGLLLAMPAWAISTNTLTVTVQGSGTIATNPVFATYPNGATVTLTATPSTGWYFGGWSGAVTATTNPVNVTMTGDLSVTGLFLAFPTYTFNLVTNGQGSIALSPAGGTYYSNTVVTATATPAAGWAFTGWSDATNSTSGTVSLALDSNLTLAGNFAQLPGFDVEPQSITNVAGSTVSFSSHSVGTAPVAYQWYFGSEVLAGDTGATLTLTGVTGAEAGFYQVIATNLYGSATSAVVALVLTNVSESTNVVSVCDEAGLQAAISEGGWVSIGCSGTITLTNTLTITKNVILDGTGVSAIISGGNAVQLFYVDPGVSFSLTNLTLANGSSIVTSGTTPAAGGAIYNHGGIVTLTDCTLTNNSAIATTGPTAAEGGAIFNYGGTVRIYGAGVFNNTVDGGPTSGINGISGPAYGGAIFNTNGSVIIVNSLLQNNLCTDGAGQGACFGGAIFQASGGVFATNSILATNEVLGGSALGDSFHSSSPAYGGALAAAGGSVSLDHCKLVGNVANGGNASYGVYAAPAFGGAVYASNNLVSVSCSFTGNQAMAGKNSYDAAGGPPTPTASGGAICNLGSAVMADCLISANTTMGGTPAIGEPEGAANGGNSLGGGVFNAATLIVTNCTITLNAVVSGPGLAVGPFNAVNGEALGGGVFNSNNATFLGVNVTIASNFCDPAPTTAYLANGLTAGAQIANTSGTISLLNSLLAYGSTNGNAYGEITDLGDNISSDGSANFESGSSFNFTDPLLGPLANNGGPTLTMALSPASPAIGYANSGDGAPPDDQRGYARPTGIGVIDLGAYQYGATQIYIPPPTLKLSIASAYPNIQVSFTTSPLITNTIHFQSSTNLINWIDLETIGALASPSNISQTISPQSAHQQFYRLWW